MSYDKEENSIDVAKALNFGTRLLSESKSLNSNYLAVSTDIYIMTDAVVNNSSKTELKQGAGISEMSFSENLK